MPQPTSDLHLPVCLEMRRMRDPEFAEAMMAPPVPPLPAPGVRLRAVSEARTVPPRSSERIDHGSVDSSETFASCNTHPSLSEGDLVDGGFHLFGFSRM